MPARTRRGVAVAHAQPARSLQPATTIGLLVALRPADMILRTVAYPDTVECIFYPKIPRKLYQDLKERNDGRLFPRRSRKPRTRLRPGQVWVLSQPTARALRLLERYRVRQQASNLPKYAVYRVDIAIDFICDTELDAQAVGDFLRTHTLQKWHGSAFASDCCGTYYSAPAHRARNVVIYSDKPSKITGDACAHLELRFRSVRKCREKGFDQLEKLVAGVDVMALLEHELKLSHLDQARFESFIERFARHVKRGRSLHREKPIDEVKEVLANVIASILQNAHQTPEPGSVNGAQVQDAYDRFKKLRRSLIKIGWDEFTNPPEWRVKK